MEKTLNNQHSKVVKKVLSSYLYEALVEPGVLAWFLGHFYTIIYTWIT